MTKHLHLRMPFFEIGPKLYLYGDQAVKMAVFADGLCEKYNVDIIFSAQYTDINPIASETQNILVFAQHMDNVRPGRGIGAVLPEALLNAGAKGTLLNHAERPLTLTALSETIRRAEEAGLASMVCAGSVAECRAVACLSPDIILAEAPSLIGKGHDQNRDMSEIAKINEAIHEIDPKIPVLHGAGISDEQDVYRIIAAGADGTGSTSGIFRAEDPYLMLEKMICSMREAWDRFH